MRQLTAVLRLIGLAGLVGCGRYLDPGGPSQVTHRTETLTRRLTPYPHSPADERWYDIADQPYSQSFRDEFSYAGAQVDVRYEDEAPTLAGTFTAARLKPNFAYQVKLYGRPTVRYPWKRRDLEEPRNWTNKQFGSLGRWACETCAKNVPGNELGRHKGHAIAGYVLLGYFVTDSAGNATPSFSLDSSLHVLWRLSQRRPKKNDTPSQPFTVAWSDYGYAPPEFPPQSVALYAEWEPKRPQPGRLVLPDGEYRCRLLLTEESFHNRQKYPAPDPSLGGFWAHVLADEELAFAVVPAPAEGEGAAGPKEGV